MWIWTTLGTPGGYGAVEMFHGQFQDCPREPLTRGTPPPKTQESNTCHQILSHLRHPIHLTRLKETLSYSDLPHSQAEAQRGQQRNSQSLSRTCEELDIVKVEEKLFPMMLIKKERLIYERVYTNTYTHMHIYSKSTLHIWQNFFFLNYSSIMSAGK